MNNRYYEANDYPCECDNDPSVAGHPVKFRLKKIVTISSYISTIPKSVVGTPLVIMFKDGDLLIVEVAVILPTHGQNSEKMDRAVVTCYARQNDQDLTQLDMILVYPELDTQAEHLSLFWAQYTCRVHPDSPLVAVNHARAVQSNNPSMATLAGPGGNPPNVQYVVHPTISVAVNSLALPVSNIIPPCISVTADTVCVLLIVPDLDGNPQNPCIKFHKAEDDHGNWKVPLHISGIDYPRWGSSSFSMYVFGVGIEELGISREIGEDGDTITVYVEVEFEDTEQKIRVGRKGTAVGVRKPPGDPRSF